MLKLSLSPQLLKLGSAVTVIGILLTSAASLHAESAEFKRPKIHKTKNIYERCDLISFNGHHTLVPKNGLLIVPEQYKDRVTNKPKGKFLNWANFYKKNYQWIHQEEISIDVARGKQQIPDGKIDKLKALGMVVVVVHKGNPISRVNPQPITEE